MSRLRPVLGSNTNRATAPGADARKPAPPPSAAARRIFGRSSGGLAGLPARPKRSTSSASTKGSSRSRRSGARGVSLDDDDGLDVGVDEAAEHAPLGQVDTGGGGDDDGGQHRDGERSRQARLSALQSQGGEAAADAPAKPQRSPPTPAEVRASVDRFIRATAALSVKASIAPQGAPAQGSVRIADSIRRLMLELLQATSGAARLDKGGLAQVKQHLLEAIATRSGKDKPAADSFAARLNLMLPLLLLQLQLPRTQEQAGVSIAKLMVMVHGRSAGPGTGDPPPPYTALPNYDSLPPRYAATEKGRGT